MGFKERNALLLVLALVGCVASVDFATTSVKVGADGSATTAADATAAEVVALEVEHSFASGAPFTPRGHLELTGSSSRLRSVQFSEALELTSSEVEALKHAITTDGLYRIRVRSSLSNATSPFVMAAVRACDFLRSDFKEELKLLLGKDDTVLSLEYRAPQSIFLSDRTCDSTPVGDRVRFTSMAALASSSPAQAIPLQPPPMGKPPPGVQPILPLGPDGKPQGADPKQSQSFLRRYWYIILPVALLLLGGGEPEQQQGQGQGRAPASGTGSGGSTR